jgi:uncharacterized protein (TIGR02600 family)
MKTFPFKYSDPASSRGAALIIALAIMVIVLALVMGILSRVTSERAAAGGYASSVRARLLADTAVQLVQAQIGAATTGGTTVAWASQPGLIRTFDNTGSPLSSYKLYSSDDMQPAGALVPSDESAALAGWFSNTAHYTDLNQPVDANLDGTPDTWPILDPAAPQVAGFKINSAPVGSYQGVINDAPMPVKWLYVLQDGQVIAPTGGGSTATVNGADDQNPVVGRIAFWTDDETCKVNVNTASEGTYWDIPRARNEGEKTLALHQPTQHEFQAYPGHPATTSLSAVFPGLTRAQIMDLVPRIQDGGSMNGTVDVSSATRVTLDQDRLYANEEELLFAPDRSQNAAIVKSLMEQSKFFLTTTSRAPETNLFNLPKISIWPIHASDDTSHRTSFDRLIAFCSTLNDEPYYFQRQNSQSGTDDYTSISRNIILYSYLQDLMARPVPGFGGTLSTKFGADKDQVPTEIFDYIRNTNLYDANLTAPYALETSTRGESRGEVVPITIGSTRGFGRYLTLSEAALWIVCTGDAANAATNDPSINRTLALGTPLQETATTKEIRIEAALLLEPFCPMLTVTRMRPDLEILVSGLETWTIQGNADAVARNLGFPSESHQTYSDAGIYLLGKSPWWTSGNNDWGGHMGMSWALDGQGAGRQVRGVSPRIPNLTTAPTATPERKTCNIRLLANRSRSRSPKPARE